MRRRAEEVISFFDAQCIFYQGRRKRGGPGGARAPPPLFGIEKKKKGEGGERRGKRVFIQSPTEMYTCIKK